MIKTTTNALAWAGIVQNTATIDGKTIVFSGNASVDRKSNKVINCGLSIQIDAVHVGGVNKNGYNQNWNVVPDFSESEGLIFAAYEAALIEIENEFKTSK